MTITGTPKTLQVGHAGLNVSELARSIDFYTRVFGFDVSAKSTEPGRSFAFLSRDGQPMLTLWQQSHGEYATDLAGLHHLAFQVESIEDVRAAEARLRELSVAFIYDGIVPHAEGAPSGGIYFTDPDGIRLEIYAPTGVDGFPAPDASAPSCGFF